MIAPKTVAITLGMLRMSAARAMLSLGERAMGSLVSLGEILILGNDLHMVF